MVYHDQIRFLIGVLNERYGDAAQPVSGSYEDADAIGLFESMEPDENAERVIRYDPPPAGMEVVVTAQTDSNRHGMIGSKVPTIASVQAQSIAEFSFSLSGG